MDELFFSIDGVNTAETSSPSAEIYAKFFQGLANATRLRIVEALLTADMNVSQLVERLGVSQSQISNQLTCLKWCGYVSSTQQGKFVVYRITDERVRQMIALAKQIVAENAQNIHSCTRM